MVALLSPRLPIRRYFGPTNAYLACAIIKMSRNVQHSHSKGGGREEEEREESSTGVFLHIMSRLIHLPSLHALKCSKAAKCDYQSKVL